MNELRAEAEQLLGDLPFESCDQYEAIQITSSQKDNANPTFEDKTFNEAGLRAFIDDSLLHPDTITLKLVRMHYHPRGGFKSSLSIFQHVWHSFGLDPYMIYMFHHNVPGFHQLSASPSSPLQQFYVNYKGHWLLWTYDPLNVSTNAILLSHRSPGGRASYPGFHARLKRYRTLVGHSLFLALATTLNQIVYVDSFLREQSNRVNEMEKHTGFSHFHIHKPRPQMEDAGAELARLSDLSRSAGSVLVGLADMIEHLHCSSTVVEAILNSSLIGDAQRVDIMTGSERDMKSIASVLGPQLKETFRHVEYIRERAKNHLTVVWFPPIHWINQLNSS